MRIDGNRPWESVGVGIVGMLLVLGVSNAAFAFHSGGTGECSACHSLHSARTLGNRLLKQSDPSSVCLTCHQADETTPNSYRVATPEGKMPNGVAPQQRTPGGDFGWLKKNYTYQIDGATISEDGSSHGHNIVAADFGFAADPVNTTAPGGSFPSSSLGCTSCHDPHGRYRRQSDGTITTSGVSAAGSGSYDTHAVPAAGTALGVYRLLAGAGYTAGGATFTGVPAAVAPAIYNKSEASTQVRVAYGHATGSGRETWSRWCATCHPQMLSKGHAADVVFGATARGNYVAYVKSGDMSGSSSSSYLTLVPFAENTSDYGTLAGHAKSDDSMLGGPDSSDLVTCLTCHRAHATGWEHMMRWNDKATFLTYNSAWPGTDTTPDVPESARGRTSAETQAAYYDRPWNTFATYQRTLCNKCHAKD